MKRTQIQFDETTYMSLKNRAHAENRSMAAVVRDAVDQYLDGHPRNRLSLKDFAFIASGSSDPSDPRSGSIHHDDIFVEAALE